ncbi:HBL/NHE enterotoxin family protein [Pseudomonas putida]|uniref:HBL/NHE enterotoxin family protein n=1 Tax=Pseudomonas putida TaxID=303 RepID=UPI0005BDCA78|nr:HBL/NHE enterotoxin family protein [Pseudomonas putida]
MNDMTNTAQDEDFGQTRIALRGQSSAAMLVQAHCMGVQAQPFVDFGSHERLKPLQNDINNGLTKAKQNAAYYLDDLQPRIITTLTNIEAFFELHNVLPQVLQPSTSTADAIALLQEMESNVEVYRRQASIIQTDLSSLRTTFAADKAFFVDNTTKLNALVNGDNGVLASINDELSGINGKIAGAATGIALGGLAAIGGVVMILVGAVGSVVTGGAATALCVGGSVLLVGGVAGAVGSSIALAGLLNLKADLITRRERLNAEVAVANGLAAGFGELGASAGQAQEGAQLMANAWGFMGSHLETLRDQLKRGQIDSPMLRQLIIRASQGSVRLIQVDVDTIKRQMTTPGSTIDTNKRIADMVSEKAESLEEAA